MGLLLLHPMMPALSEGKLESVLLFFFVPVALVLLLIVVNFLVWNFECNRFVWLSCEKQVLVFRVDFLDFLLKGTHDSVSWMETRLDFREGNLEIKGLFSSFRVPLLDDSVARPANFQCSFFCWLRLWDWHHDLFFHFPGLPSLEIRLVLFPLSVSQITPCFSQNTSSIKTLESLWLPSFVWRVKQSRHS